MISHEHKLIFVHIPRTSGTSIEIDIMGELVDDGIKHLRASTLKKIHNKQWDNFFKFSIVRNPWDRLISLYHAPYYISINALGGYSLEYFLDRYAFMHPRHEQGFTQCDYLDEELDLIIRFEEREIGLQELFLRSGYQVDGSLSHRETSRKGLDYRNFYDSKTKDIVWRTYHKDIERFNYEF